MIRNSNYKMKECSHYANFYQHKKLKAKNYLIRSLHILRKILQEIICV